MCIELIFVFDWLVFVTIVSQCLIYSPKPIIFSMWCLFGGRKVTLVLTLLLISSLIIPFLSVYAADEEVIFRVGWDGTSFDTFNPFTTYAQVSGWVSSNVYDYLVRFNKDYASYAPDLAESWDVNATTAIFHLVRNATFHDGKPVTAEDVKYSFELAMSNWSRLGPNVEMITSIEVIDNYTVKFNFKPTALFMSMAATAIPIVPKHIWEAVDDPATYPDYPPIGSGPFKVTDYKEGQYIELTKNDNYFLTSRIPNVDKVVLEFFSDVPSATQALKAGDIDAVGPTITPTDADQMKSMPDLDVVVAPGILYYYMAFNVYPEGAGNPTLRDKTVRIALAHAVNVTEATLLAWHGYAKPLYTVLPSSNAFHNPNISPYEFNLTLAAKMLDDAGYKVGGDGVRVSPEGVKMEYTILVPSSMPEAIRVAQQIAQWWSQINVKAEVQAMDTGSMAAIIWAEENGTIIPKHDIDLWDWFVDPGSPLLLSVFLSTELITGTSDSGYVNPDYDALYKQMLNSTTFDEVRAKAFRLQEILHEDLPYLPLYEVSALQAYNKKFTGFDLDWPGGPFGGNDWTVFYKVRLASAGQPTTPTQPPTSPPTSSPTTPPPQSPTSPTTTPTGAGGGFTSTALAIIVAVIVLVIVILVLVSRRK